MAKRRFIKQNPRRVFRCHNLVKDERVFRSSVNHFDRIKVGISDGFSSSTGLFDSEDGTTVEGPLKDLFSVHMDKFDLADSLMRRGDLSQQKASDAVLNGNTPLPSSDSE